MKSKVTTYLLYAIGEITLVVVGILIAVQIDDWNKQRERLQLEITTLKQIKSNLQMTVISLNKCIEDYREEGQLIKEGLHYIKKYQNLPDSMHKNLIYVLFFPTPKLNTSAYENLKNIGTDLIRNDTLRSKIIRIHEDDFYYLINELDQAQRNLKTTITPMLTKYIRIDATNRENRDFPEVSITNMDDLTKDEAFINTLYYCQSYEKLGFHDTSSIRNHVEELIAEIDKELERLK